MRARRITTTRQLAHRPAVAAVVAALLGGCLPAVDSSPPIEPMCESSNDCDNGAGEVCDLGICWGDPAAAQFAAVIVPPTDRTDLVSTQLPQLQFTQDGWIENLAMADSIELSGRVVLACDAETDPANCNAPTTIAAQLRFERESRIPGGPTFSRTILAQPNLDENSIAFALRLPRTNPGDAPYSVTITPDNGTLAFAGGETPAELAPPTRFTFNGEADLADVTWTLGTPTELKIVSGKVVDAIGNGVAGLQVTALGRWSPLAAAERASSLAVTDDKGAFILRVPTAMLDLFEIVVKPTPGVAAPTVRVSDVSVPDPADYPAPPFVVDDIRLPSFSTPVPFSIPVVGLDGGGTFGPVVGADVRLTTTLVQESTVSVTYTAQGFTDASGVVRLELLPGGQLANRDYAMRIAPPPGSQHQTALTLSFGVGLPNPSGNNVLAAVELPRRVPVRGRVAANDGKPLVGATITPRFALAYRWSIDRESQGQLDTLQLPTATSDENGDFVIWLDSDLYGGLPSYDLDIIPAAGAAAPRWTINGLTPNAMAVSEGPDLGELRLPPAFYARAVLTDEAANALPGADVRIYEVPTSSIECETSQYPPDPCLAPAILRGGWTSAPDGSVWVALPDTSPPE